MRCVLWGHRVLWYGPFPPAESTLVWPSRLPHIEAVGHSYITQETSGFVSAFLFKESAQDVAVHGQNDLYSC